MKLLNGQPVQAIGSVKEVCIGKTIHKYLGVLVPAPGKWGQRRSHIQFVRSDNLDYGKSPVARNVTI